MKDREPALVLVKGSKYRIVSLETRDKPLVNHGTFKGYVVIGNGGWRAFASESLDAGVDRRPHCSDSSGHRRCRGVEPDAPGFAGSDALVRHASRSESAGCRGGHSPVTRWKGLGLRG